MGARRGREETGWRDASTRVARKKENGRSYGDLVHEGDGSRPAWRIKKDKIDVAE